MGRGKLNMELIAKEKSRNATFLKRKKGLKKKTYEFSTLCSVDACLIIYGPKQGDRPIEPEIWPENYDEVRRIINRYQLLDSDDRRKRNLDLIDMFKDRKKKIEDELTKMRRKNEVEYQTWDDRINDFTEDQLRQLLLTLDSKLDMMNQKIGLMKGKQRIMEGETVKFEYSHATQNQNPCHLQSNYLGNNGNDSMHVQPITAMKPLDQHFSDPSLIFDSGPLMAPMAPMMPMNGYNHHDFNSGPVGSFSYPSLNRPFLYDQGMKTLNGIEFSNMGPSALCPYTPYLMPGTSIQMNLQPFDNHFDYQDSQIMHRSTRF